MLKVPEMRIILVTYGLCIAFGVVGNLMVLVAMLADADRKSRTTTNVFLASLAVSQSVLHTGKGQPVYAFGM